MLVNATGTNTLGGMSDARAARLLQRLSVKVSNATTARSWGGRPGDPWFTDSLGSAHSRARRDRVLYVDFADDDATDAFIGTAGDERMCCSNSRGSAGDRLRLKSRFDAILRDAAGPSRASPAVA